MFKSMVNQLSKAIEDNMYALANIDFHYDLAVEITEYAKTEKKIEGSMLCSHEKVLTALLCCEKLMLVNPENIQTLKDSGLILNFAKMLVKLNLNMNSHLEQAAIDQVIALKLKSLELSDR